MKPAWFVTSLVILDHLLPKFDQHTFYDPSLCLLGRVHLMQACARKIKHAKGKSGTNCKITFVGQHNRLQTNQGFIHFLQTLVKIKINGISIFYAYMKLFLFLLQVMIYSIMKIEISNDACLSPRRKLFRYARLSINVTVALQNAQAGITWYKYPVRSPCRHKARTCSPWTGHFLVLLRNEKLVLKLIVQLTLLLKKPQKI